MKLLIVFGLIFFTTQSQVFGGVYGIKKRSIEAYIDSSLFNTKENFDSSGTKVPLPQDTSNELSEYRVNFGGSYAFSSLIESYLDVSFKRVAALGVPYERTNTNFSEGTLGFRFMPIAKSFRIIPDISVTAPMHSTTLPDAAILDDHAYSASAKLYLVKPLGKAFTMALYSGFNYKTEGLSSQIPYGLLTRTKIRFLFFDVNLIGYESMKNDKFTSEPKQRTDQTDKLNAQSLIYYSVNPSLLLAEAKVGVRFLKNFTVTGGADYPINGKNTASGMRFLLTLGFNLNFASPSAPKKDKTEFVPTSSPEELEQTPKKN